jgi:hypothetical protein
MNTGHRDNAKHLAQSDVHISFVHVSTIMILFLSGSQTREFSENLCSA